MNKQQIIDYFKQSKQENVKGADNNLSVLPDYFKQQMLSTKVHEIINELGIQNFLFHATKLNGAIGIYESEMILPKKNYVSDFVKELGVYLRANSITDGTTENIKMAENIFSLSEAIKKFKNKKENHEKILDFERKIHVLSQLIDENYKIYLHDLPNFTFKWDKGSINLTDQGSVLFCINSEKVHQRKKYFYYEYIEGIPTPENAILYYLDDNSEPYIQNYVKQNGHYRTYEIVSYEPILIENINYMIVFNRNEICVISNDGLGEYQIIKELSI